jgi:putative oxidoreductase
MTDMKEMEVKSRNAGLLLLRLTFGLGMAYHGYGKVFGGHMDNFTANVGGMGFPMPAFFAWSAALSEFAGGLAFAAGLLTLPATLSIIGTMGVAAFIAHGSDPFAKKELALAYLSAALTILFTGPGAFSLDELYLKDFYAKWCKKK